jgi:chromosome segregation ATPase
VAVARAQPSRPLRPLHERKIVAVGEPLLDSSDDNEECDAPFLVACPSRRKNQAISHASLQANCRRLKQRHAAVKDELTTLQKEHSETADKVQCLSSKLVQYEEAQSRNELVVSEARKNNNELSVIKAQLVRVSGNLVAVAGNYEATEQNYQDTTQQLSRSLTELKSELDVHMGTKAELADAAAKLIVMRGDIVDASIEIEEARMQLFNTTGELIGANDNIAVLEGLYRQRDFQDSVTSQSNEDRTLMQKLNAMTSGDGKWKRLAHQLFNIQILPHLIKLSVENIREKTYTVTSMVRVMDLHQGFNLCRLDAFRLVEPAYLGHERLLWSSSSVKRVFRQIEK